MHTIRPEYQVLYSSTVGPRAILAWHTLGPRTLLTTETYRKPPAWSNSFSFKQNSCLNHWQQTIQQRDHNPEGGLFISLASDRHSNFKVFIVRMVSRLLVKPGHYTSKCSPKNALLSESGQLRMSQYTIAG